MKLRKNILSLFVAAGLVSFVTSCSSDDDSGVITPDGKGRLSISAKASTGANVNRGLNETDVVLSSFKINFTEIELEFADESRGFYDSDDDIELKGPFIVELLDAETPPFLNLDIPNGVYEEIEFEFDKNRNTGSEMYGQSIRMEGLINGVPFIFWHDFEEEIELEFEEGRHLVIDGNRTGVLIDFDLDPIINSNVYVDFSTATDNNGDGIIEISPRDNDGNRELADQIKRAIKRHVDLLEDQYDD